MYLQRTISKGSCPLNSVGKSMSTKAVGSNAREDVTIQYKYKEGSDEERAAVVRAVEQGILKSEVPDIYNQEDKVCNYNYNNYRDCLPPVDMCTIDSYVIVYRTSSLRSPSWTENIL